VARKKALVVLDDVSDVLQAAPLIPAGSECAVLITSRQSLAMVGASAQLTLGPLRPDEAIALLARLAGRQRTVRESGPAAEIAALCGYLPLALRIAAARLAARPGLPLSAFARRLGSESSRLDELDFRGLSVRGSLAASYEAVSLAGPGALAARLFRLLGLSDGPDVDVGKIAVAAGTTPAAADLALEQLLSEHLVEASGPGHCSISDLTRLYARELLQQDMERSVRSLDLS
jgi:hypothetical protein